METASSRQGTEAGGGSCRVPAGVRKAKAGDGETGWFQKTEASIRPQPVLLEFTLRKTE